MSVAGLERMTTGSIAKRLTLPRHTSRNRQNSVYSKVYTNIDTLYIRQ